MTPGPLSIAIHSVVLGFLLAPLWGAGSWMKWQSMKTATILPAGGWTRAYGTTVSFVSFAICVVIILWSVTEVAWWLLLTIAFMWFIGGWLGTIIERRVYANETTLALIVDAAGRWEKSARDVETLKQAVPEWWIKLMPRCWRQRLHDLLTNPIDTYAARDLQSTR